MAQQVECHFATTQPTHCTKRKQASGEENDIVTPYGKLTPRYKPGLVPIIATIYPADPCLCSLQRTRRPPFPSKPVVPETLRSPRDRTGERDGGIDCCQMARYIA
ncbi:hypothetical protein VTN96DRAFT_6813 [Rasamsonia emersonii]